MNRIIHNIRQQQLSIFTAILLIKLMMMSYFIYLTINFHIMVYDGLFILSVMLLIDALAKKRRFLKFFIADIVFTAIFISISLYFGYFGTLPTYYELGSVGQVPSLNGSVIVLFSPLDGLFFYDVIIMLIMLPFYLKRKDDVERVPLPSKRNKLQAVVAIVFLLIGTTGFFLNKTNEILDNGVLAKKSGIFNMQLIQAYASIKDDTLAIDPETLTLNKTLKIKGIEPEPVQEHPKFGVAEGRNLIVIQMESLQDFVIGRTINGQEITPHLNDLRGHSLYFNNIIQSIGAGNTSDAEFLMNTSLYPAGKRPTVDQFIDHKFPSLPKRLAEEGYHSATFHTDDVTFWNRDELYPALGYDDWYDKSYFGEQDVVGHGASDDVLYSKSMDVLKNMDKKGPFYANIVSITAHSPFEMPPEKQELDLPNKYNDTLIGDYLQAQHYADAALGRFIKKLKAEGLWQDSMLFVYGDHSGIHGDLMTDEDRRLLNDLLGQPYSPLEKFNIPLMVSIPGKTNDGQTISKYGGQIDFMPTAMSLLGVDYSDMTLFGQDLLAYDHNMFGMRYYLPSGSFFNQNILYIGESARKGVRVIDLSNGKHIEDQLNNPKDKYDQQYKKMLQLLDQSDAYIQTLPTRNIE
ncbi:LTA synthase family protein [Tuberibacillus sp. Marseille-P3662]|uniref:LTA synthase family protein n=1 Tax=Tuberibacillus sp. Marseille-P3662 TaxID=1965358 RepID=UPI000A1CB55F|nr:LTA synthase family protein [Tuberibacillus sp. Marseille-P3662]